MTPDRTSFVEFTDKYFEELERLGTPAVVVPLIDMLPDEIQPEATAMIAAEMSHQSLFGHKSGLTPEQTAAASHYAFSKAFEKMHGLSPNGVTSADGMIAALKSLGNKVV